MKSMKKTMLKQAVLLLLAFLMLTTTSCNQRVQERPNEYNLDKTTEVVTSKTFQRSSSEAIKIVQDFVKESGLRSSLVATDAIVDYVLNTGSLRTTLGEQGVEAVDTVLYIVNIQGEKGFSVIAGDKRLPDILITSSSGNLFKNEEIDDNSGFAVFLSRLPSFYVSELERFEKDPNRRREDFEHEKEFEPDAPAPNVPERKIEYSEWKTVNSIGPLVPVQWEQSLPFNNEAPLIDGQRALAGCVSIAAAQLTAYHNYPSYYNGISLDWNLLTRYPSYWQYQGTDRSKFEEQVSKYLREIGNTLQNSWGVSATGAWTKDIVLMLKSMGYSNPSSLTDYEEGALINSLAHLRPAIMEGYSEKYTYKKGWWIFKKTHTGYREGHAWLVDGYITQERTRKVINRETNETISENRETRLLVHCNWGWGGYRDGYFYPGVFESYNSVNLRSTGVNESTPGYFKYMIKNIVNVYK